MAKKVQPEKQPPMSPIHKISRLQWAEIHMERNMNIVLFTLQTRATLIGPDG